MAKSEVAAHPLIVWSLISTIVLLVAIITYVYTNRNRRATFVFSLIAVVTILLFKLVGTIDKVLKQQFIGRYDIASNKPYIFSEPGWHQIIDAWHIWALPVVIVAALAVFIIYMFYQYFSGQQGIEVLPTPDQPLIGNKKTMFDTSSDKLNTFMAMNAAKRETQQVNEKLAEALLLNAAYEIKLSDLNLQIQELEKKLEENKQALNDEIVTLQLELSAKGKENEYIAQQLSERTRELLKAQEMFEKLLRLQQQKGEI